MNEKCFHVVCIEHDHYPELIFGKIYQATEDEKGKEANYIRVWGESDEDYLFPQSWFKIIELSKEIEEALAS